MLKYKEILLILVFALVLRLPLLSGSFWLDEAAQALESSRPLSQQYQIQDDFQPPLLHYIVHFMLVVSREEWWLRMVSVVAGIGSIAFLYFLVEKVSGRKVAIIASLFLATSAFHIFFSQELRQYSLATFFAVLSWYALLRLKDKPKHGLNYLFVFATVAGLYSMYIYPFILLSQLIYVGMEKKASLKSSLVSVLIALLCFLPWLPFFLGQLNAGTSLTKTLPGWSVAVAVPQLKALPLTLAKYFLGQVELQGSVWRIALICIPVALLFAASLKLLKDRRNRVYLYWFFIPLIVVWLVSFVVPVIAPKRLMVILPAMWAILGVLLAEIKPRSLRAFGIGAILSLNLWMTSLYYVTPRLQREDWRGVIGKLETESKGIPTAALFAFPDPLAPWRWYSTGQIPATASGTLLITNLSQVDGRYSAVLQAKRVYLFDYLRDLSDPKRLSEAWLEQRGYTGAASIDGGTLGFVRVYERR